VKKVLRLSVGTCKPGTPGNQRNARRKPETDQGHGTKGAEFRGECFKTGYPQDFRSPGIHDEDAFHSDSHDGSEVWHPIGFFGYCSGTGET
jgi:hypothetical protein